MFLSHTVHILLGSCHPISHWFSGNNFATFHRIFTKFIHQTLYHNILFGINFWQIHTCHLIGQYSETLQNSNSTLKLVTTTKCWFLYFVGVFVKIIVHRRVPCEIIYINTAMFMVNYKMWDLHHDSEWHTTGSLIIIWYFIYFLLLANYTLSGGGGGGICWNILRQEENMVYWYCCWYSY